MKHIEVDVEKIVFKIFRQLNSFTDLEKIELLKKVNQLYQVLYENDDYGYSFYILYKVNYYISLLYLKIGENDKSLKYFNFSKKFFEEYKKHCDFQVKHTSLLFKEKNINNKKIVKKIDKFDKIIKDTNFCF